MDFQITSLWVVVLCLAMLCAIEHWDSWNKQAKLDARDKVIVEYMKKEIKYQIEIQQLRDKLNLEEIKHE